jgi:hypothetical protein
MITTHSPVSLALSVAILSLRLLSSAKMEPRRSLCPPVIGLQGELVDCVCKDQTTTYAILVSPLGSAMVCTEDNRSFCGMTSTELCVGVSCYYMMVVSACRNAGATAPASAVKACAGCSVAPNEGCGGTGSFIVKVKLCGTVTRYAASAGKSLCCIDMGRCWSRGCIWTAR